ncbi:nucleoside diphosphate kinase homolog 5 [Otolemur garnettii]|uniref:nucleoside diphosphate kinase homolog 5 n=1 Tax=Otolemur garnettii TaxID=30611 RepID=UPI000C7EBC0B|nr:nucleoside diphosphate kinase homolog 5 [Otolemur garnettii]
MEISMPPPQIHVEKTLTIIKPDIVDKEEEIQDIILRSGFTIVQRRKLHLSPEQCSNFYVEQYGKMFFPNLTAYMSSGPLVAMILARHKAISVWKELLGPSNSLVAKETHPDSANRLVIIEPIPIGQSAKDYLNLYVTPTLLGGLTELCKQKPADPFVWLADWLLENNPNKPKLWHHPITEEPY